MVRYFLCWAEGLIFFQRYSMESTMLIQLFFLLLFNAYLLVIWAAIPAYYLFPLWSQCHSEFVKITIDSVRMVNHFSCMRHPLYCSQGSKTHPYSYSHSNSPLKVTITNYFRDIWKERFPNTFDRWKIAYIQEKSKFCRSCFNFSNQAERILRENFFQSIST